MFDAIGCDLFKEACAATYINGLSGELVVRKFGEGTVTNDLIEEISRVIKKV